MGMDFRIVCEYKIEDEWQLLNEDVGFGKLDRTIEWTSNSDVTFWTSQYWTGSVLRSLLSNEHTVRTDICDSTSDALGYLNDTFYEITMESLSFEYVEDEDIEYVMGIIAEFIRVKNWVDEKYDPIETRLIYVWY